MPTPSAQPHFQLQTSPTLRPAVPAAGQTNQDCQRDWAVLFLFSSRRNLTIAISRSFMCHLGHSTVNASKYLFIIPQSITTPKTYLKLGPIFSRTVGPCSACPESVGSTDPTVLPARKVVLALACDPLDNHEIAFGVARFALHPFRSGAFGVGVGTAHGCTWRVGGTSAHPRSASDPSFGVRSRIHPHMRAHGPVRNTFTRGPAPASAASARSRLSRDLRPRG